MTSNRRETIGMLVVIVFYVTSCLCSYHNGDVDGRIQQKRLDAVAWSDYIGARDMFWECARGALAVDSPYPVSKYEYVKRSCGDDPQEPEHK